MHNLRKDKESALALVEERSKRLQKALLANNYVQMNIALKFISQGSDELNTNLPTCPFWPYMARIQGELYGYTALQRNCTFLERNFFISKIFCFKTKPYLINFIF